jgi:hypothetical protein
VCWCLPLLLPLLMMTMTAMMLRTPAAALLTSA